MEPDLEYFNKIKEETRVLFNSQREIFSPYFQQNVILNSDGFHHLQFSAERERDKKEQFFKFRLVPLALKIIKKAGTIQEYRKGLTAVGPRYSRDGMIKMKNAEYFGLVAIADEQKKILVKVILRRIGDGNIIFWSVMLGTKMQNGKQRIFKEGIEDL
ncbi:MAG: hypothetical protein V1711_02685 [bacterium]